MKRLLAVAAMGAISVLAWACNNTNSSNNGFHDITLDVGGVVTFSGDDSAIVGATVTLTDINGKDTTATTGSGGLWSISDMAPGAYLVKYEKQGYETLRTTAMLETQGESDIGNAFIGLGTAALEEGFIHVTVSPFGVSADQNSNDLTDGVGGVSMVYHKSQGGPIRMTFDHHLTYFSITLYDDENITATVSTNGAPANTFEFSDAALHAMNAGLGVTADNNPSTTTDIYVVVDALGSISGDTQSMYEDFYINVVP